MTSLLSKKTNSFRKIVLIDDDVANNMVFKKLANATNLAQELITIISPIDALSYFENLPISDMPDAIFLDIKMPILSGWEFLNQFKQDPKNKYTKVFIVSSSINYNDIEKAEKEARISELISKPISIHKLLDVKKVYA